MDDLERFKILIYQYILFKGDYYSNSAEVLYETVKTKKHPSADELHSLYIAQLKNEIFDDLQREIAKMLSEFH